MDDDLRLTGGTKGWVNFCCVMKGGVLLAEGPAFQRIDVQETSNEIDESYSIVHLCNLLSKQK
jgi:hypothetical protein